MISIEHVSKAFGPVVALHDVSLQIARGERVAFVGSNGSGKTTLMRALLGLLRVQGNISIGGVDVAVQPERALRAVAYIPQISPPLDAPVVEVVTAVAALRALDPSVIAERSKRLGLDLSVVSRSRFRDLSGGMKQKLLAALALATEADVLVCDEPTANLDASARAAFFQMVDERKKGSVVILCSHRVEEVRQLVDRVVEMRDGSVERDATLAELLEDLRAFRVEVALREGTQAAETFLRAHGFVEMAPGRLGATFTQAEKMNVVARLLRDHKDAIADLSVFQTENLAISNAEGAAHAPRLRVVP
ncbi:MAG TPA: ATP-binding cassette domain-containing protein [Polyangiales bacterium]